MSRKRLELVLEDDKPVAKLKTVTPKNKKQRELQNSMKENLVTFAVGSAGTGKTFLAAAEALDKLSFGFVDKIVLVRPVVATEELGFLPGDFKEKISPYLLPLMDSLISVSNPKQISEYLQTGQIEIAALAFMRGRTFNNAFIILDEAQNTTIDQMRMFLTRFGENVRVVITGDLSQSDISGKNGLQWAVPLLQESTNVGTVSFSNKEVVRSALVKDILWHIDKGATNNDESESIS